MFIELPNGYRVNSNFIESYNINITPVPEMHLLIYITTGEVFKLKAESLDSLNTMLLNLDRLLDTKVLKF